MSQPKELTQIKELAEKGIQWSGHDSKAVEIFEQIRALAEGGDARTLSLDPTVKAARKRGK